jgi:hypothetical protein
VQVRVLFAPPEILSPVLATMMQRIAAIVCRENFKRRKVQVRVLFAPLDLCKTILRNLTVCRAILDVIKTKMVKFNVLLVVLGNLNNTVGSQVVQIAQLDLNLSTPVPSVPSVMLEKQERDPVVVTRVTPVNTVQATWIPAVATVAPEGFIKIKKCKRLVYPVSPVRSVPTKDKSTV